MTVSARSRKLLWGRAGSTCAICKRRLVEEAAGQDREAIVGEECHIVAQDPGGPRGDVPRRPADVAAYENLILLCCTHHQLIDEQEEFYSVEKLQSLKDEHERWVSLRLGGAIDYSVSYEQTVTFGFLVFMAIGLITSNEGIETTFTLLARSEFEKIAALLRLDVDHEQWTPDSQPMTMAAVEKLSSLSPDHELFLAIAMSIPVLVSQSIKIRPETDMSRVDPELRDALVRFEANLSASVEEQLTRLAADSQTVMTIVQRIAETRSTIIRGNMAQAVDELWSTYQCLRAYAIRCDRDLVRRL